MRKIVITKVLLLTIVTLIVGATQSVGETLNEKVVRLDRELDSLKTLIHASQPGKQGSKGDIGPQGSRGERGDLGPQGTTGERGDIGPQGPPGEKGERGELGPQGPKGESGAVGPQGIKGEKGDQGFNTDRISFGNGFARFYDTSGNDIIYIGSGSDGGGHASFENKNGRKVAFVGAGGDAGSAYFHDGKGKLAAYIGASKKGGGTVIVNGKAVHDYADVFEFASRVGVIPGTVVAASESGGGLEPSSAPYDPKVVGVVSGAGGFVPGMKVGSRADESNDLPIAVSGQVYVRVCVEQGPISVGDLLVASSTPGVAMVGADRSRAFGAVVGKALEPYDATASEREGLVRMLVMNR